MVKDFIITKQHFIFKYKMSDCVKGDEDFTFLWKVENLDICFLHNHESFESPPFSLKNFCNTRWCMRLSLESNTKYGFEYVCSLVREYDNGPTVIRIYCKISCDSESLGESFQSFTMGFKFDFPVPKLYNFDKFPELRSLTFKCHMSFSSRDKALADDSKLSYFKRTPAFESSCSPEHSKEISSSRTEPENVQKDTWKYPKQCFAYSCYSAERRCFTYPFSDCILNGEESKQQIPVISFTEMPSLDMELRVNAEEETDYLLIYISLADAVLKANVLLCCEMDLVDSSGEIIDSGRDHHLFRRGNNIKIWNFGYFYDWKYIKQKMIQNCSNQLYLNCEFFSFDGQIHSQIAWTASVRRCFKSPTEKAPTVGTWKEVACVVNKDCDVVLRTKDRTFEAHQAVLSSTSPVFSAVLENGDSIIDITCISSGTAYQMLVFMYTETLDDLEFESAAKLFSAADRYQVLRLKEMCRFFLQTNLLSENVCTVLSLADLHEDEKLAESAIQFITINKNCVLMSKNWEEFVEQNVALAMKILKEVCVRLPSKNVEPYFLF